MNAAATMSVNTLLEDWSDYEKRKKKEGKDVTHFSASEEWEVDFLVSKIFWKYPFFTEEQIRCAIAVCAKNAGDPVQRTELVGNVARRLGVPAA